MTTNATPLTDELLRRALAELADGPDGSALLTEVMRRADTTAQVARRPWDTRGWGRVGVLVVAALLLAGAIGAAVVLSSPEPDPQPLSEVISVPGFVQPFAYRLPPGETVRLTPRGPEPPSVLAANSGSRTLEVFLVTGEVSACGHQLDPSGFDPPAFMRGLREALGAGIGPITQTTLGNLPALSAEIRLDASPCQTLVFFQHGIGWGGGNEPRLLDQPSTLIVARTNYGTVGALISATTEDDYAEWLPIARAYLDNFAFDSGPRPSDWPEGS
jgi:hypothetical protein